MAGALLTVSVVAAISSGILIGIFTGRYPHRRSWIVLAIIASNALAWTVVLALPGRAPLWLLVVLIVVISVGGPGSMVGFDFARTFNPSATLGTAQGMVNMGGFIASLLVMQAMGVILDAAGGYSFESFRVAWTVQYVGLGARRRRHPDHPPEGPTSAAAGRQERSLLETFEDALSAVSASAGLPAVGLHDRVDQFVLGHRRPARDVQAPGDVHQVLLGRVRVDALGGLAPGVRARRSRARSSDGPFSSFASQWSPTFSKLCLTALKATRWARSSSPYCSAAASWALANVCWAFSRRLLQRAGQLALLGPPALPGLRHDPSSRPYPAAWPEAVR